jgi:hypothetical protein
VEYRRIPQHVGHAAELIIALVLMFLSHGGGVSSASEVVERLASDPWTTTGLLVTKQISPWQIRLGHAHVRRLLCASTTDRWGRPAHEFN